MSKKQKVTEALDRCLVRLARGESVSQCLYDYPQYAAELRPLLEAAIALRRVPQPVQRREAVDAGYERMMAALHTKSSGQPQPLRDRNVRSHSMVRRSPKPWWLGAAGAVAVLLLVVAGVLLQSGAFLRITALRTEAVVMAAEGIVLRLPSGTRTWLPVKAGDRLSVGDRLQTASDGRATLTLADRYEADLLSSAEIVVRALPILEGTPTSLTIYQELGDVYYDTLPFGDEDTPSDVTGKGSVSFEVHTPVAITRMSHATFTMAVARDGATSVSVDAGEVAVMTGELSQVTVAGEVTVVSATLGDAPITYKKDEGPPGQGLDLDQEEEDAVVLPEPSSEESPIPPGQTDRDHQPPGLEDKDKDTETVPPGLEGRDELPPGQIDKDKDHQPPGLEDKGGIPPGQVDKDKDTEDNTDAEGDAESETVMETTDTEASTSDAEDTTDQPSGQDNGNNGNGNGNGNGGNNQPPGQADKDKDK